MMPDHTQHAIQTRSAKKTAPTSDDKAAPTHDDQAMQKPDDKTATSGAMMAHEGAQWAHFANRTLGLWLITGAFTLGYRSTALQVSEVVSGALVGPARRGRTAFRALHGGAERAGLRTPSAWTGDSPLE